MIPKSELVLLWSNEHEGGIEIYDIPKNYNCALHLIKVRLNITGYDLFENEQLIVFVLTGEQIELSLKQDSQFLILSRKPLDAKVTQHGPYIMNTQTEVLEAMPDYKMGKKWEF